MSQPSSAPHNKHSLRDGLGLALGFIGALLWTLRVHEQTVGLFWSQLSPLMPWGNYALWSLVWAGCVFFLILSAIRFGFALVVSMLTNGLSLLIVRLTLPKKRG